MMYTYGCQKTDDICSLLVFGAIIHPDWHPEQVWVQNALPIRETLELHPVDDDSRADVRDSMHRLQL